VRRFPARVYVPGGGSGTSTSSTRTRCGGSVLPRTISLQAELLRARPPEPREIDGKPQSHIGVAGGGEVPPIGTDHLGGVTGPPVGPVAGDPPLCDRSMNRT
jgi:hypothetical protein